MLREAKHHTHKKDRGFPSSHGKANKCAVRTLCEKDGEMLMGNKEKWNCSVPTVSPPSPEKKEEIMMQKDGAVQIDYEEVWKDLL